MSTDRPSERQLLINYFTEIDGGDVIALPPSRGRFDQSDGHHEAREVARARGISSPVWLFWHSQAATSFDADGQLIGPLRINWGGDHPRIAGLLARLGDPFRVADLGPGGVFEITSTAAADRRTAPFPETSDTAAVKARIKLITARANGEPTATDWAWLNRVLIEGDRAAQGYVVRHLAGADELTDEAFDAMMADWAAIYTKAPTDVLVRDLLHTLHRRADPRLDDVINACARRKRWTFAAGVAHFLADRGDPAGLDVLYTLALTPGRYEHTPGNAAALRGWVRIRTEQEGRNPAVVATEALTDPAFDPAARRALQRIVDRDRV